MLLYHGTSYEKAISIIEAGHYHYSHEADNPWSSTADEGGLFCSNVSKYAAQYGTTVVEIAVNADDVLFIQDCPIDEGDYGWQPEFAGASEYLIPSGVEFSAKIA